MPAPTDAVILSSIITQCEKGDVSGLVDFLCEVLKQPEWFLYDGEKTYVLFTSEYKAQAIDLVKQGGSQFANLYSTPLGSFLQHLGLFEKLPGEIACLAMAICSAGAIEHNAPSDVRLIANARNPYSLLWMLELPLLLQNVPREDLHISEGEREISYAEAQALCTERHLRDYVDSKGDPCALAEAWAMRGVRGLYDISPFKAGTPAARLLNALRQHFPIITC